MRHQEDSPAYWRRWLREQGLTLAVERHVNEFYRNLRDALERMWTFAYVGGVIGALVGAAGTLAYLRLVAGRSLPWLHVVLAVLGAAVAASLLWWVAYWLMRRPGLHSRAAALSGEELQAEDVYIERVLETVADGLAKSEFRPRDEKFDMDELTKSTVVTGLREAPTTELERHLLERLVGSAYVPTADGSIFVFRPGEPCSRCAVRTRTGPLRLLNVPAHWAAENGYQRLKELPSRGRHLLVVPQRAQDVPEFLGKSSAERGGPMFFGPNAEVLLCERCGKEALNRGVLQDPVGHK